MDERTQRAGVREGTYHRKNASAPWEGADPVSEALVKRSFVTQHVHTYMLTYSYTYLHAIYMYTFMDPPRRHGVSLLKLPLQLYDGSKGQGNTKKPMGPRTSHLAPKTVL